MRSDARAAQDAEMGELVEYGFRDTKQTSNVRLHIVRVDQDCKERDEEGRYFVKVAINRREHKDRSRLSCTKQSN